MTGRRDSRKRCFQYSGTMKNHINCYLRPGTGSGFIISSENHKTGWFLDAL